MRHGEAATATDAPARLEATADHLRMDDGQGSLEPGRLPTGGSMPFRGELAAH